MNEYRYSLFESYFEKKKTAFINILGLITRPHSSHDRDGRGELWKTLIIFEKRDLSLSVEEGIFRNSRQSGKKRSPRKVLKKSEKKREQHFPSRAPQENSKVLAPGGMAVKLRNLFRVLPRTSRAAIPTDRCLTEKFSRPLYAPLLSPTEFHPRFQISGCQSIHYTCIFT